MVSLNHLCRLLWVGGRDIHCMNEFCFIIKKPIPFGLGFLDSVYGLRYS